MRCTAKSLAPTLGTPLSKLRGKLKSKLVKRYAASDVSVVPRATEKPREQNLPVFHRGLQPIELFYFPGHN
jgi:hypothetical protein